MSVVLAHKPSLDSSQNSGSGIPLHTTVGVVVVVVVVTVGGMHVLHITGQSDRTDSYNLVEVLSVHAPWPKTGHSFGSTLPKQFGASGVVVVVVAVVTSQLSQSTLQLFLTLG